MSTPGVYRKRPILLFALLLPAAPIAAVDDVAGPVNESGFLGYLQEQDREYLPLHRWPGLQAKHLSEDPATGRLAARVEFPAGFRSDTLPAVDQSIDLVVLDGALQFGAVVLGPYGFAFNPPGQPLPLLSSEKGAHALVFFDPASSDPRAVAGQLARGSYARRYEEHSWQPAALARAAGATASLEIMHLKQDPDTTARSWFVRLSGGMSVPWEVHSMTEEGYVIEGAYRLAECLPDRTVMGEYRQGGYFLRPGGIPHSGPDSGPIGDVIWLQRSPLALDVVFFNDCQGGVAIDPIRP